MLEETGIVRRIQVSAIPPHVEYSLTEMGGELRSVIAEIRAGATRGSAPARPTLPLIACPTASVYTPANNAKPPREETAMIVTGLTVGLLQENCYILGCETTRRRDHRPGR